MPARSKKVTARGKNWHLEFDTDAATALFEKRIKRNSEKVGQFVVARVKQKLSKGQPTRRSVPRGGGGGLGRLVSAEPATPGAPPRVLHGRLRQAVDFRVVTSRHQVSVLAGAATKYARRLELGWPVRSLAFVGTIGTGQHPYLRPTIAENRAQIVKLFTSLRG